jgi:hypothetical protein
VSSRRRAVLVILLAAGLAAPAPALPFDSDGHDVIEALVYRTLIEGYGKQPPRPDVLRDLINDGALVPPVCFGRADTEECREAATANPLLAWPQPLSDRPDYNYRRQFSDEGQCFHFMARIEDEDTPPIPGTHIPRDLAVRAVVRCRDLLDRLLDAVVDVGGRQTRQSGYGLYELMHAVQDSFSYAHTQRQAGTGKVEFLRVWEPMGRLAGGRLGVTYSQSPTRHDADEPRDAAFLRNYAEVEGRPCRWQMKFLYAMPYACLSSEGDDARQAVVDLLIVVDDLRKARLARGASAGRASDAAEWKAYKERWFDAVYACQGPECDEKQPAMRVPASNLLLGLEGTWSPSAGTAGVSAWGWLFQSSPELNPFVYAIGAQVGYRHSYDQGTDFGIVGVGLNLFLPVGRHTFLGFMPAQVRVAFGANLGSAEIVTQALLLTWRPTDQLWLGFQGPMEIDWSRARVGWSFGLTLGLAPAMHDVNSDTLLARPEEHADRHDDEWAPEPLWYGRLKGRVPSIYASVGVTAYTQPSGTDPLSLYGYGGLGATIAWDRDHWGGRFPTAWGLGLSVGDRHTTGTYRYLVFALTTEWRWYLLGGLGLSVVPVRVEFGPHVTGGDVDDPSPYVYGTAPNQWYFQAGSRLGLALNAGVIDLLVQAPTLAWHSNPFQGGEILSFQIGVKVW